MESITARSDRERMLMITEGLEEGLQHTVPPTTIGTDRSK